MNDPGGGPPEPQRPLQREPQREPTVSHPQERFTGKQIPTSPFSGDSGLGDPAVEAALRDARHDRQSRYAVVEALLGSRLFVAVVAVADTHELTTDGHQVEKDSHMATMSVQRPDGVRAMVAFTDVARLADYAPDARPQPAHAHLVAAAALQEGAQVLLINPRTDTELALDLGGVIALAQGRAWIPPAEDPEVQSDLDTRLSRVAAEFAGMRLVVEPGEAMSSLVISVYLPARAVEGVAVHQPPAEAAVARVHAEIAGSDILRSRAAGGIAIRLAQHT